MSANQTGSGNGAGSLQLHFGFSFFTTETQGHRVGNSTQKGNFAAENSKSAERDPNQKAEHLNAQLRTLSFSALACGYDTRKKNHRLLGIHR